MALFFGPDASVHPYVGQDIPAELLLVIDRLLPEAFVLVNLQTGGRHDREVDLVTITRNGIYIVEVKDRRNPIVATANGAWSETRPDGKVVTIVNRRQGKCESPVLQAKLSRQAVQTSLGTKVALAERTEPLHTYPYVLIPYPNPLNEIDHEGGLVRVIQGIDAFVQSVTDRECPLTTGPLGYGLTDEQAMQYITALGLVRYDVMTLVRHARPAPAVTVAANATPAGRKLAPDCAHPGARHVADVQASAERHVATARARLAGSLAAPAARPSTVEVAATCSAPEPPEVVAPPAPPRRMPAWRQIFIRLASVFAAVALIAGS